MSNRNFKLSIVLLLVSLLFLSVCVVSANDNLTSTGINSFDDLNKEIQSGNDYIILTNNVNGLNGINEGIVINHTLIIDGNGFVLDAKKEGRFFQITNNGNLTLKNITLKNGDWFFQPTTDSGGAIKNYGILIIKNSIFDNNCANGAGAISNNGILEIYNSTFKNNKAVFLSGGGAIGNEGNLKIFNSIFYNNVGMCGGAIWNKGNLEIYNSTFNKNNVNIYGGAIYNIHNLKIYDCNFSNNKAEMGAALYIYQGIVELYNSSFMKNIAKKDGGAIYFNNEVKKISFFNNQLENSQEKGQNNIYCKNLKNVEIHSDINIFNSINPSNNIINKIDDGLLKERNLLSNNPVTNNIKKVGGLVKSTASIVKANLNFFNSKVLDLI